MQINRVNNTPSFGMAWDKGAKKTLAKIVKKLPAEKAEEAIQKINWLEANSPYHGLHVSDVRNAIYAWRAEVSYGKSGKFRLGNIIRFLTTGKRKDTLGVLDEVTDFIYAQNTIIPKIKEAQTEFAPKVEKIIKKSSGWEYDDGFWTERLSLKFAEIAQEESVGPEKALKLIEQLARITKKAHEAGCKLTEGRSSYRHLFVDTGSTLFYRKGKQFNYESLPDAFDKIEKFLDKQIIRKRLTEAERPVVESKTEIAKFKSKIIAAKEGLYWEKRTLKKAKKEAAEKKKEIKKEVFDKSPIGRFINGVKTRLNGLGGNIKSKFTTKKLTPEYIESRLQIAVDAEKTAK